VSHRKKLGTTEIDLIFKTPRDQLVLIEIKSSTFYHLSAFRWGESQRRKFFGVLSHLTTKYPHSEIYGVIAMVDYNKIDFYYMDET
jgi:Holliday junction resolvase-like predicted endonuclease